MIVLWAAWAGLSGGTSVAEEPCPPGHPAAVTLPSIPLEALAAQPSACDPDPFGSLCASYGPRAKVRWKATREESKRMVQRLSEVFNRLKPLVDKKVGKLGGRDVHGEGEELFHRWKSEMDGRIEKELTGGTAKDRETTREVKFHVMRAFGIFKTALDESQLPAPVVSSIAEYIQGCVREPLLVFSSGGDEGSDGIETLLGMYSVGAPIYGWKVDFATTGMDQRVAIRSRDSQSCSLRLTGQGWIDCARGSPSCYQTLFHEFSHYMNACAFLDMYLSGKSAFSNPSPPVQRSLDSLKGSYDLLRGRSECLKEIAAPSVPKDALMQFMGAQPQGDWATLQPERCRDGTQRGLPAPRFPSQWNEAEADFWGATAYAVYLRQLPLAERQAVFGESVAM
jgi:hypothetical protein